MLYAVQSALGHALLLPRCFSTSLGGWLGGWWWPIEITPEWMPLLRKVLPSGWAMDAMHPLISFGKGAGNGPCAGDVGGGARCLGTRKYSRSRLRLIEA